MLRRIASIALLLSVFGCTGKNDDGNKQVLDYFVTDDMKHVDPANAYDTISLDVLPSIYETLYQYEFLSETYKIVPLLAADLPKVSKDHLTYTIPLKHGVRFHDSAAFKESDGKGRELKAQDFVYAWKRLALPALNSSGWWIFDGKIKGINAFHDQLVKASKPEELKAAFQLPVEGMKALDDYTVQIQLTKAYPQLMYILAMTFTAPVPHEAVEKFGDEKGNLVNETFGTGPFVLTQWDRGNRILLDRNLNYHTEFYPAEGAQKFRAAGLLADAGKPLPLLDRIRVLIIKESQPAWLKFLSGELDMIGIPKDNFSSAVVNRTQIAPDLAAKGIKLHIEPGTSFYYITFNFKDPLLGKNKFLRQAISAAINRDQWIETFTNGRGQKMTHALPPGIQGRGAAGKIKYDYNLTLAKELLKKAGYPEGKGLPVLKFDLRGADSQSRQMGEFFQSQFSAVGIRVETIYNTFPAFLEKLKTSDLQVYYGGWQLDYPDAENVYQLLYGPNSAPGPNDSNFNMPEVNQLYEKIATMESSPARSALISRLEDIIQEEVPWAYGYYVTSYTLTAPWLSNFRVNDLIPNKFKYMRINRETKLAGRRK